MFLSSGWKDYEIIDCGDGEKLERFGDFYLVRPDPQAIWSSLRKHPAWEKPNAHYYRSSTGGGKWEFFNLPESWQISYKDIKINLKPMNFKHTGVFPEQAANWDFCADLIKKAGRPIKVLNLFAYTGCASVACAAAGAEVCHVDAAKGMVLWAKENASSSGIAENKIRYIVDDCKKFVEREFRRGKRYDAIIMDPPSYGRGPSGEIWKLEQNLIPLVEDAIKVLSDEPLFFVINSYTAGLAPSVMKYILGTMLLPKCGGQIDSDELGLPVSSTGLALPCGMTARWYR